MCQKPIIELSPEKSRRSRNMQSDILHAVAETKQVNVAKCLGVESSTVGRWLDSKNPESQVVRFCDMLALCGLKVVPVNAKCYDAEKMAILFRVTKYHFQNLEEVDDFFQSDAGMFDTNDDTRFSRVVGLSEINTAQNTVLVLLLRFLEASKNWVGFKKGESEPVNITAPVKDLSDFEYAKRELVASIMNGFCIAFLLAIMILGLMGYMGGRLGS